MASNETSFRRELIDAFALTGAHVFSVNQRFMSGVPDVYVKHPIWPATWLELKYIKAQAASVPIALTPLQRRFLEREQDNGGQAGWVVCVEIPGSVWVACAGWNPRQERAHLRGDLATVRHRGDKWYIRDIMAKVVR